MSPRLYPADDFEAAIRILGAEEGGRRTAAANGIRWDFSYTEDPPGSELYMIWPDFLDERGDSRQPDEPLPLGVHLKARMLILNDDLRREIHQRRLREGVRFFCHEGSRRVAEGRVTRITGLRDERRLS